MHIQTYLSMFTQICVRYVCKSTYHFYQDKLPNKTVPRILIAYMFIYAYMQIYIGTNIHIIGVYKSSPSG
jgi:hypothetical protein